MLQEKLWNLAFVFVKCVWLCLCTGTRRLWADSAETVGGCYKITKTAFEIGEIDFRCLQTVKLYMQKNPPSDFKVDT